MNLEFLYLYEDLKLKIFSIKFVSLVALALFLRAKYLSTQDLHYLFFSKKRGTIVFRMHKLLKTTRPVFFMYAFLCFFVTFFVLFIEKRLLHDVDCCTRILNISNIINFIPHKEVKLIRYFRDSGSFSKNDPRLYLYKLYPLQKTLGANWCTRVRLKYRTSIFT